MSPSAPASERGYGRVGDDGTSREERQAIYRKIPFERISETELPIVTRDHRPSRRRSSSACMSRRPSAMTRTKTLLPMTR